MNLVITEAQIRVAACIAALLMIFIADWLRDLRWPQSGLDALREVDRRSG
jgi:hypothetical protein